MLQENFNRLESLVSNKFLNMNFIKRWANACVVKEESDAKHTMDMILIALNFYDRYPKLPIKDVVYRITMHDLDEAIGGTKNGQVLESFGDIPSNLKYYSDNSYDLVMNAVESTVSDNLENKLLANDILKAKYDFTDEQTSAESAFVNILDSLQPLIKLREEYRLQGATLHISTLFKNSLTKYEEKLHSEYVEQYLQNDFWKEIYDECCQYYDEFREDYYKFKR